MLSTWNVSLDIKTRRNVLIMVMMTPNPTRIYVRFYETDFITYD
jgi:hypothetical protein